MNRIGVRSLLLAVAIPLLAVGIWAASHGSGTHRRASPLLDRVVFDLERLLPEDRAPEPVSRPRRGGLDVTFLVSADAHFGPGFSPEAKPDPGRDPVKRPVGIDHVHSRLVRQMNSMANKRFPRPVGGRVGEPRGLLMAGDLTEDGDPDEWRRFVAFYGLTGKEGLLRMPVYETVGNHDLNRGDFVARQVAERHGADHYSWDWGDLHLVCLGEAPDRRRLEWLEQDLAKTGRELPIVIYFHYPLDGPYSTRNWFGDGDYRQRLLAMLEGFNVVGVFHGHYHASGVYRYQGYDVYNVGSAKHGWRSFAVVHVTDERMAVCSWNYQKHRWWWWHTKPINDATDAGVREVIAVDVDPDDQRQPVIFGR